MQVNPEVSSSHFSSTIVWQDTTSSVTWKKKQHHQYFWTDSFLTNVTKNGLGWVMKKKVIFIFLLSINHLYSKSTNIFFPYQFNIVHAKGQHKSHVVKLGKIFWSPHCTNSAQTISVFWHQLRQRQEEKPCCCARGAPVQNSTDLIGSRAVLGKKWIGWEVTA